MYEDQNGGKDLGNILNGAAIEMNGSNSIALFHTFREGVSTEQIFILPNGKNNEATEGRTIPEEALEYKTTIKRIGYEYEEEGGTEEGTEVPGYPILGFFAEPYVPINANRPDKLARLLIDSDEKYTLRSGDILELGENYSLKVGKIDLEEEKVWLEFAKEGQYIREGIIETSAEATAKEKTWDVILDGIGGEDNVTVLRVHVDEIFHDCTGNIIRIKGIWLIDYRDIFTIKAGDEFGKFEVAEVREENGPEQPACLVLKNKDPITFKRNSVQDLGSNLSFKVADDDELRFYLIKEFTEPGTYEIKGSAPGTDESVYEWDYQTFPYFFYDLDNNLFTETLKIDTSALKGGDRKIDAGDLIYLTNISTVNYEYNADDSWNGEYPILCLFGEDYIPLKTEGEENWEVSPDKLAKLVLDSDETYTLRSGERLDFEQYSGSERYSLEVKSIDVGNDTAWLEFRKNGELVGGKIVDIGVDDTWELNLDDIEDENNITVLRVHVNRVFKNEGEDLVEIKGLWFIDYKNAFAIELDDEFGELKVAEIRDGNGPDAPGALIFEIDEPVYFERGSVLDIGENIKFRILDEAELKFYPFAEWSIRENTQERPQIHVCWDGSEDYASIQEAVDNALDGDTIVVHPGVYKENVNITKELTITTTWWGLLRGNALVQAENSDRHVFHVSSDGVRINGLTIVGSLQRSDTGMVAGVFLDGVSKNVIQNSRFVNNNAGIILSNFSKENLLENNIVQKSNVGIFIEDGIFNTLKRNSATLNDMGIYFNSGRSNTISKNSVSKNNVGIRFENSTINQIFQNTLSENSQGIALQNSNKNYLRANRVDLNRKGILLENSRKNSICDNHFNNTNNVELEGTNIENCWNTSKVSYANILDGPNKGGNYWEQPDGRGFSQIYPLDENGDLISDLSYEIGKNNIDHHPLLLPYLNRSTRKAVGDRAEGAYIWNASNCDLFYYSSYNKSTETLSVTAINHRNIREEDLVYTTQTKYVKYRYAKNDWENKTYPIMGFLGEMFTPLTDKDGNVRVNKLARLLVDDDEKCTLKTGEFFDLDNGYALEVRMADSEKNKVWLTLSKNGEYVVDEIIDLSEGSENGVTWDVYLDNIEDEDDILVLKVHINKVFRYDEEDIVQIEGLWFIDYNNAFEIEHDDEFGILEVADIRDGTGPDDPGYLILENNEPVFLGRDSEQYITGDMEFYVLDTPELRYYPVIEIEEKNVEKALLFYPFYPFSSVITSMKGKTQEFNISCNKISTIKLLLDGKEVKRETDATFLSYRDNTTSEGTHKVRAIARTDDEVTQVNWIWTVCGKNEGNGGGSSGSGGGGGGSPEPASNVESKELSQRFVTSGRHISFGFPQAATCVRSVEFDAGKSAGKVTTIVEMLKGKSELVHEGPEGEVYRHLNIWVGQGGFATPENIINATIDFDVEKAWIEENGIEESTICLCRHGDGRWTRLLTEKTGEEGNCSLFEAKSPGFSPFAITGEKKAKAEPKEVEVEIKEKLAGESNETGSKGSATGENEKNPGIPGTGTSGALAMLLAGRSYLKRH